MDHITSSPPVCPVCMAAGVNQVLRSKDHTVTQEEFQIWQCNHCTLRFTYPAPEADVIGRYYNSNAYVSHSDSRQGIINRLYHIVRKKTLKQKVKWIREATGKQTGKLLDVGAGTGAFVHTAALAGWKTMGLEPDATAVTNAKILYGAELQPLSLLDTLPAGQFDAITLWHVLEHVHDLHGYMEKLGKLLAPGGRLLIALPNYTSLDAARYGKDWAAYDVPRHLYHFSPESMLQLSNLHNLQILKKEGMWFDSYYVSMLSEQHMHGRSGLLNALFTGWKSNAMARQQTDRCSSIVYILATVK